MFSIIRTWILGLAGAALFCAIAEELTPSGMVKHAQKMICGVVMAIALISPLPKIDFGSYSLNLAKYREAESQISDSAQEISDRLSRTIIQEQCEAYILDKAQILDADLTAAKVTVKWSGEGVWYPVEAEMTGSYSGALSDAIEAELGIGSQQQRWITDEND